MEYEQQRGLACVAIRIKRSAPDFEALRDAALAALHPSFIRHAEVERDGREFALYIG